MKPWNRIKKKNIKENTLEEYYSVSNWLDLYTPFLRKEGEISKIRDKRCGCKVYGTKLCKLSL